MPLVVSRTIRQRLTRMLAVLLGAGGLLFATTSLATAVDQHLALPLWWSLPAELLLGGGLVALLVAGVRPATPARLLRRLAGAYALTFLLAMASLAVVLSGALNLPDVRPTWLGGFVGVATAAGAVAWSRAVAAANLVVVTALYGMIRWLGLGRPADPLLPAQDTISAATVGLLLLGVVWLVMDEGTAFDRAARNEHRMAVEQAQQQAVLAERARLSTVVHDNVLATLRSAVRAAPGTAELVRAEARTALLALDDLRRTPPPPEDVTVSGVLDRLEELAGRVPGIEVRTDVAAATTFPGVVVEDVLAATAEALRNVARHADPHGTHRLHVRMRPGEITVRVRDDGPGFATDAVPSSRMGLALSIRGRMEQLPGGWSRVVSAPGRGTDVSVGWHE